MLFELNDRFGLALHTCTADLGLAIGRADGSDRCRVWQLGRELSSHLHLYLAEFLLPQSWQDLGLVAVAKGPGGFTGTRIGVVTARTLAQQLDLPLFGISTLAAIAWAGVEKAGMQGVIAVEMRAQRGELFTAIYEAGEQGLSPLQSDTVMRGDRWQEILEHQPTPDHRIQADTDLAATVDSLLHLAWLEWQQGKRPHWSEVLPFYGQHPVTV